MHELSNKALGNQALGLQDLVRIYYLTALYTESEGVFKKYLLVKNKLCRKIKIFDFSNKKTLFLKSFWPFFWLWNFRISKFGTQSMVKNNLWKSSLYTVSFFSRKFEEGRGEFSPNHRRFSRTLLNVSRDKRHTV